MMQLLVSLLPLIAWLALVLTCLPFVGRLLA